MAELQEIFREYGAEYCRTHKLSPEQGKAMRAVTVCRTAKLGGHMDTCLACGYEKPSYNSCRNRHCPKCQLLVKERWIERYDLLHVGYFHVVFTVPAELNQLIYQNPKTLYNLLFRTVAETMTQLAADKKYLGAAIGFTAVLHTWGQNLMHHPHIYRIVPAGGLIALPFQITVFYRRRVGRSSSSGGTIRMAVAARKGRFLLWSSFAASLSTFSPPALQKSGITAFCLTAIEPNICNIVKCLPIPPFGKDKNCLHWSFYSN